MMSLDIILFKFSRIKVYVVVLLEIADSSPDLLSWEGQNKTRHKASIRVRLFSVWHLKDLRNLPLFEEKSKSLKSQNWVLEKISNVSTSQGVKFFFFF